MKKKYIFTITSGRTGTKYLTTLFNTASPQVVAFHEPDGESSLLPRVNKTNDTAFAKKYVEERKIHRIKQRATKAVYVETSHLLCKGSLEHILPHFDNVTLLYLYRDFRDVATSLYLHKTDLSYQSNCHSSRAFYRFPSDQSCLFKLPENLKLNKFEYCLWQSFEIMKVYQYFKTIHNDVRVITLDSLNTLDSTISFLQSLEIPEINFQRVKDLVGKVTHKGKHHRSELEFTEAEVNQFFIKMFNLYIKSNETYGKTK